jgi:hypothetical protein
MEIKRGRKILLTWMACAFGDRFIFIGFKYVTLSLHLKNWKRTCLPGHGEAAAQFHLGNSFAPTCGPAAQAHIAHFALRSPPVLMAVTPPHQLAAMASTPSPTRLVR